MAIKEFILSKIFRKHLLIAVVLTLVLLWFTMLVLSFYTHKGESLPVPDFSGKTMAEAQQMARKMNLRFEVEDSVYKAGRKPGTILMQNPGAGRRIKSGRLVYLTLVAAVPVQEEVPKLTDISLRQAKVLLEAKGFVLGKVDYIPSEFSDLVLEQKNKGVPIVPGTRLFSGETIDLVVGRSGSGSETTVPDFSGMTLAEAQALLGTRQLQPGSVIFDTSVASHADSMAARVVSQFPKADSTVFVPSGSLIDFVLSIQAKE